jgi:hypothetical protein
MTDLVLRTISKGTVTLQLLRDHFAGFGEGAAIGELKLEINPPIWTG